MAKATSFVDHKWWKEANVYQIYPASFLSTGSGSVPGWGDINGITKKLDYLKALGVDVVWLSPIYKSPQVDMGYDIADYTDVDPRYGKLADMDKLIKGATDRGLKIMMDLVVNHTSDQHAWFLDSKKSQKAEKRDWYIWQPPKKGPKGERLPPNNWASILGDANSAWTWNEETQEYYLALFTPEQPDLNWRNEDVREAVHDILKFWLDRGVSGFRMDVINLISKEKGYPDGRISDPGAKYQSGHEHFANGPHLHDYLQDMNEKVLSKYDTITVGEMPFIKDKNEILKVVKEDSKELNMIFIFELVDIDNEPGKSKLSMHPWKVSDLRKIMATWQDVMRGNDGWNSLFIENHDNPRSVSRYVDDSTDESRELGAKLLALMQTTLSGTLYIYQGEELGMHNFPLDWGTEEYKDIETQNYWKKQQDLAKGDKEKLDYVRKVMQKKARDHSRTPVQWNAGPNAGFCDKNTEPWMRVNTDYKTWNADAQQQQGSSTSGGGNVSVLQFWQRCLQLRKKHKDTFIYGEFEELETMDSAKQTVFAYRMSSLKGKQKAVVVLNFSDKEVEWVGPKGVEVDQWVVANYSRGEWKKVTSEGVTLRAWEGVMGMVGM